MTTPNTTARKKNSVKRQRNLVLRVRVLPSESDEIRKRAAALGVSLSEVLRGGVLDAPYRPSRRRIPTVAEKLLAQVIGQLGRVGTNLKDLAHISRIDGQVANTLKLSATLTELRAVLSSLIEVIE